jgi:ubiquinone/menaquinone biosynthesis C-methylase UbiE
MDTPAFKRASRAVWEAMAPGWDDRHTYFEETARPVTERMLELLAPAEGQTILDLAAGTGVVGFAAAPLVGPSGRVIVSDFAEAMVDVAQRHVADLGFGNVECRVLDAERLDLPDEAVDGVLCRWGYMLMPEPAVALAETRRVLRGGGRLVCSVFAGPEQNPWAALPARVLHEHGHMPPPEAGAPGILALADRDRLRALFEDTWFPSPRIEEIEFVFPFADAHDYWDFLTGVAGAIAMVLDRLDEDERARVREQLVARVAPFEAPGGIELPALALIVSAS